MVGLACGCRRSLGEPKFGFAKRSQSWLTKSPGLPVADQHEFGLAYCPGRFDKNEFSGRAMFVRLSKVLTFFLVPSNIWSASPCRIALLAIGYARVGRWLLVASILLITAVGMLPIGSGLALPLEARFPSWDAKHGPPTGIVVVGGGVIKSEISTERGEVTVGRTVNRIIAAVELARHYPDARLVFAGRAEGDFIVRLLEKVGVSKDRVIVERESRNTLENAAFAKQLVMPKAGERWLLVTSAMQCRALLGFFARQVLR